MRSPSPSLLTLVAAAALGGVHPGGASAQTVARTAGGGDRVAPGWIGINLEVTELHGPDGRIDSRLVIRGVVDGSPADEAEIRPGDRILRLNGQPATYEAFSRVAGRLRPGDRFQVTLARDGWTQEVILEAAAKPAPELVVLPGPLADRLDSAIQRLDSLRVGITRGGGDPAAGPGAGAADALPLAGVARLMAMGPDSTRSVILYSEGQAQTAWSHVISGHPPEVTVSFPDPGGEAASYRFLTQEPDETELRRLEVEARQAQEEALGLHRIFERTISRATGRRAASDEGPDRAESDGTADFRPLTPYIVGQNRVAGAALTPLNPRLASYFDVEGGLLVTVVTEGTPADEAGLVPGDVVVRVGERPVSSLEDVRRILSRGVAEGVSLRVVRRGRPLRVTLPR